MLLDIVEVACSHSSLNLAAAFSKILDDFGISYKVSNFFFSFNRLLTHRRKKILSITCDNASNNDMMVTELVNLIEEFPGPANQTQCSCMS